MNVGKVLKIVGIVLLILSPFILFLLTLLIPVSKVNNLAIKLGVNNVVGKYYTSSFYAKAFKFVNKNRLSCTKDGTKYFLGEYYLTPDNCFICLCTENKKFNCVSNSGNTNPVCRTQPGFIPTVTNPNQTGTSGEPITPSSTIPEDVELQRLEDIDVNAVPMQGGPSSPSEILFPSPSP